MDSTAAPAGAAPAADSILSTLQDNSPPIVPVIVALILSYIFIH